jgi:hypothetical protein
VDELPAGYYRFIVSLIGGGEAAPTDEYLDAAPAPGQGLTVDGRNVIVRTVTPDPYTEIVATVTADEHPG